MPDDRFNEYCEDLLVRYKRRNSTTLTRRLESLCTFLRQKGDVVQICLVVKRGTDYSVILTGYLGRSIKGD